MGSYGLDPRIRQRYIDSLSPEERALYEEEEKKRKLLSAMVTKMQSFDSSTASKEATKALSIVAEIIGSATKKDGSMPSLEVLEKYDGILSDLSNPNTQEKGVDGLKLLIVDEQFKDPKRVFIESVPECSKFGPYYDGFIRLGMRKERTLDDIIDPKRGLKEFQSGIPLPADYEDPPYLWELAYNVGKETQLPFKFCKKLAEEMMSREPKAGEKPKYAIYIYKRNMADPLENQCTATESNNLSRIPGIYLTKDELEVLFELGDLTPAKLCCDTLVANEGPPKSACNITRDIAITTKLLNELEKEDFSDPRIRSKERREEIIDALRRTKEMKGMDDMKSREYWQIGIGVVTLLAIAAGGLGWLRGFKFRKAMKQFGRNVTEAAKKGELSPYVNGKSQLLFDNILGGLDKRKLKNVVILGPAGTGKTSVVEGLSQAFVGGNFPQEWTEQYRKLFELGMPEIWEVRTGEMQSNPDAKYISVLQGYVIAIFKEAKRMRKGRGQWLKSKLPAFIGKALTVVRIFRDPKNILLFGDEVHAWATIGTSENNKHGSLLETLKPYMSEGGRETPPFIGASTTDEYARDVEPNVAADRRFPTKVYVNESTFEETLEILKSLRSKSEADSNMRFSDETLAEIIRSAPRKKDKQGRVQANPACSIAVIDVIANWVKARYRGASAVTPEHVKAYAVETLREMSAQNRAALPARVSRLFAEARDPALRQTLMEIHGQLEGAGEEVQARLDAIVTELESPATMLKGLFSWGEIKESMKDGSPPSERAPRSGPPRTPPPSGRAHVPGPPRTPPPSGRAPIPGSSNPSGTGSTRRACMVVPIPLDMADAAGNMIDSAIKKIPVPIKSTLIGGAMFTLGLVASKALLKPQELKKMSAGELATDYAGLTIGGAAGTEVWKAAETMAFAQKMPAVARGIFARAFPLIGGILLLDTAKSGRMDVKTAARSTATIMTASAGVSMTMRALAMSAKIRKATAMFGLVNAVGKATLAGAVANTVAHFVAIDLLSAAIMKHEISMNISQIKDSFDELVEKDSELLMRSKQGEDVSAELRKNDEQLAALAAEAAVFTPAFEVEVRYQEEMGKLEEWYRAERGNFKVNNDHGRFRSFGEIDEYYEGQKTKFAATKKEELAELAAQAPKEPVFTRIKAEAKLPKDSNELETVGLPGDTSKMVDERIKASQMPHIASEGRALSAQIVDYQHARFRVANALLK